MLSPYAGVFFVIPPIQHLFLRKSNTGIAKVIVIQTPHPVNSKIATGYMLIIFARQGYQQLHLWRSIGFSSRVLLD